MVVDATPNLHGLKSTHSNEIINSSVDLCRYWIDSDHSVIVHLSWGSFSKQFYIRLPLRALGSLSILIAELCAR